MSSTELYAPIFPQMNGDSTINLAELVSSGIIIDIAEYATAKKGDFIELWFESYVIDSLGLAEEPVSQYFPWQCTITPEIASLFEDGIYQVQYKVVDIAQNSSWSSVGNAIIDRTATGTLPPPLFLEAGSDNTLDYDDALSLGGTTVTIPAYPGIAVNDNVTLYWAGFRNEKLIQSSVTRVSNTVKENQLNGFDLPIATAYIVAGNIDKAKAWYIVEHPTELNERSAFGIVDIDTSTANLLPPPDFIEGEDEWIDYDEAYSDNGTPVQIPAYPGMAAGDIVTTYWQGFSESGQIVEGTDYQYVTTVSSSDLSSGFIVNIPINKILPVDIGYGISYYNVHFVSNDQGSSLASRVGVDVIHSEALPAPLLPEATDDNVIDNNDALSEGGTPVTVSYPDMVEGDNVTINWSCYHAEDIIPVEGTVYAVTHSVTSTDVINNAFTLTIPAKYITPTGKGYAVANYTVNFKTGGIGYSDDAMANIDTQGEPLAGSGYLGGSTGYAPWSNTVIQNSYVKYLAMENNQPLRYANVTFTLYGNNYFTDNAKKTITLRTDINGYVETNISGSDTLLNTLTANIDGNTLPASTIGLQTERTNDTVVPYLSSDPYIPGSGNRNFILTVSHDAGEFMLSTNNNSDIFIDGVNKGSLVSNLAVYSASPVYFSVSSNNLNNTKVAVSTTTPDSREICSFYF